MRQTNVTQSLTVTTSIDLSASPLSLSSDNIMQLLRIHRCRVLHSEDISAAEKLAQALQLIVSNPDSVQNWLNVLTFSFTCFQVLGAREGKSHSSSLASKVDMTIANFPGYPPPTMLLKSFKVNSSNDNLAARVSGKLEDGDIRGAIRLAASDDIVAPFDDVTTAALRTKHPAQAVTDAPPPIPTGNSECLCLQESDLLATIKTFVPGSAGGPDGLRPQHLKDMTGASAGA
jgi:hypothetical protein